jgi:two-component system KDP operon response regulator KdpE
MTHTRSDSYRILLVEDDAAAAELVAGALSGRGHDVRVATTGQQALDLASEREPDVVVLDLGLPDIDGTEVCRQLRRWSRNPIIVLSADGDEERKVTALDGGADDYVTKPFSVRELLARMRVALRHRRVLATVVDPAVIEVGDLRLDTGAHVADLGGEALALSPKEFALLAVLARNAGRVMTYSALLDAVWGTTDRSKTESLRVHVKQLRRKLGEDGPRLVTEPAVGFRLVVDPSGD